MRKLTIINCFVGCFAFIAILISCKKETFIPKPRSFFRIDLPSKTYISYDSLCDFTYEYPSYTRIIDPQENCNQILLYPKLKASIYFTYRKIEKATNFKHFESAREQAYEHRIKAQSIDETLITNDSNHVYGILYEINGNVASNLQFFVTDSNAHFFRGALYFEAKPNFDSLLPEINFIKEDILRICNTIRFKD